MTDLFDAFSGNDASLYGALPTRPDAGFAADHPTRVGFFTDTSVCIGCEASKGASWPG